MAIYHCSIKNIGRSNGRSAVASAAYRAGEKLTDYETGMVSDYTRKGGVIYSEIMLPDHAPKEYKGRETLWNAVHKIEKNSDARLAREIEVALPVELSHRQQLDILHGYIQKNFVDEGMCADFAIHDKGDGNPHAHIMLTTRPIKDNGEWGSKEKKAYKLDENGERIPITDKNSGEQKIGKNNRKMWQRETVEANDWNKREKVELWREAWAKECNLFLDQELQIDHRSYERQGIDKEPTVHEGAAAREMEKRGVVSDRCEENRNIKERNSLLEKIKVELLNIKWQLERLFSEKEKIKAVPVVSFEVARKIEHAIITEKSFEKDYENINADLGDVRLEIAELPVKDMQDAYDARFFAAHIDKFKEWQDAPDRKLIFGKTKNDLLSDPDTADCISIYQRFNGVVPSLDAADRFEKLKKTELQLEKKLDKSETALHDISEKIDRLQGELVIYPDKTAQIENYEPLEVDYIDYFPQDWTAQKVMQYAADRDRAYDESEGDYIEFCKKYAPTPENEARRAKEREERERERIEREKAAKEAKAAREKEELQKFTENFFNKLAAEKERQRPAPTPKKENDKGWDIEI